VAVSEIIPTLTCSPANQTINVGNSANFSASGGTGTYSWTGGDNHQTGNGANFSTSFNSSGSRTVTVASGIQSATCSISVNQITPLLNCFPQNQNVNINDLVSFSATGGSGGYSWFTSGSADPNYGYGTTFGTRFSQSGYKTVTVNSNGYTAQCMVNVNQPYVPPYIPPYVPPQDFQITKNVLNRTLNQSIFVNRVNAQSQDLVEFEIRVPSRSGSYLVRDILPQGLSYVSGTTRVNLVQVQDGITSSGIYVNSSAFGAYQSIRFLATVDSNISSGELINQAFATINGVTRNAWAYVDIVPRGIVLGAASIVTGPETDSWLISLGFGFLTSLLLYYFVFRRRFGTRKNINTVNYL
jgi:hypothetical protein